MTSVWLDLFWTKQVQPAKYYYFSFDIDCGRVKLCITSKTAIMSGSYFFLYIQSLSEAPLDVNADASSFCGSSIACL